MSKEKNVAIIIAIRLIKKASAFLYNIVTTTIKRRIHLAYIHSIAKLFEIKDPNIVLEDKVDPQLVSDGTCKVIFGTLAYQPAACPNCSVVNHSSDDLNKIRL